MDIQARQKGDVIILDIAGIIDANAASLIEVVGMCVRQNKLDILCNFENVERIDYMGVSVVVIAYKETCNHRGRMKFTNVPLHLRSIFNIAGLEGVLEFYPDESQALHSFKEDRVISEIQKRQLRRRFKRLGVDIKVEFVRKHSHEPSPNAQHAEILDISALGAFIFGASAYHLGDVLQLKMKLPPQPGIIEVEARVVWLSDKEVQPQYHPGMGVEFYDISTELQKKILSFVERNLPLIPNQER